MRHLLLVAAAFSVVASHAAAQDVVPFQLGIGGDFPNTAPLAYSNARAEDGNFILTIIESFIPLAAEQAADATESGLNAVVCGLEYGPFPPTSLPLGEVVVPMGNAANATAAAQMMLGEIDCQTFLQQRVDPAPDLAPSAFIPPGLTIVSPSDSIFVGIGDIFSSEVIFNPSSGRNDLHLRFFSLVTDWLSAQTSAHTGQEFQLLVCGEVVNAPLIQAPISSGVIIIAGPAEKAEAELEMERILGSQPCP
jgi:hypothetical protein